MQKLGSGPDGQFTFLDMVSLLSFLIGTANLQENLTQGDKQDLMEIFSKKTDDLLKEIHQHLKEQDNKIDIILEELSHDS